MSILTKDDILKRLKEASFDERIVVSPLLTSDQIGPSTIDLRLGNEFIITKRNDASLFDPNNYEEMEKVTNAIDKEYVAFGSKFYLHPNKVILAGALEFISIPNTITGRVCSRSSFERLGLSLNGIVQPGYRGCLTLVLVNLGNTPITLYPGIRVAQLSLFNLSSQEVGSLPEYDGKYRAEIGPVFSKAHHDLDLEKLKQLNDFLK